MLRRSAEYNSRSLRACSTDCAAQDVRGRAVEPRHVSEVQQHAQGRRVGLEDSIQTVADGGGVAEDDVAAQPIDPHPLTLMVENGAMGGGTGPLAAMLAQG